MRTAGLVLLTIGFWGGSALAEYPATESGRPQAEPAPSPGSLPSWLLRMETPSTNWRDAEDFESFLTAKKDLSLKELVHEADSRPGRRDWSAEGPKEHRYVNDPADPLRVIDMRHFLIVGSSRYPETMGLVIESGQQVGCWTGRKSWKGWCASAFDREDLYSNALGKEFFETRPRLDAAHFTAELLRFFKQRQEIYCEGPDCWSKAPRITWGRRLRLRLRALFSRETSGPTPSWKTMGLSEMPKESGPYLDPLLSPLSSLGLSAIPLPALAEETPRASPEAFVRASPLLQGIRALPLTRRIERTRTQEPALVGDDDGRPSSREPEKTCETVTEVHDHDCWREETRPSTSGDFDQRTGQRIIRYAKWPVRYDCPEITTKRVCK